MRVQGDVIVLQCLLWPDEVRSTDTIALGGDISIGAAEAKLARTLITTMTGDLDTLRLTDTYRDAVSALLDSKLAGASPPPLPDTSTTHAAVVDLMTALKVSVEQARARRKQLTPEPPARKAAPGRRRTQRDHTAPARSA